MKRSVGLPVLVACFISVLTGTVLAAVRPAGKWAGDGVTLELVRDHQNSSSYHGTLEVQGGSYPASGQITDSLFEGSFKVQGRSFGFTLKQNGPGLLLESDGRRYELNRLDHAQTSNPLAGSSASGSAGPTASSVAIPDLGSPRLNPDREWTILLYLDGDNNLEAPALGDVNELEAVAGNPSVEVLVLLDRAEGYSTADGDWTGTRLYRVTPGTDPNRIESELIMDLGELDMSDPQTLRQSIARVFPTWPSRKQALIMWDHGGGWVSHSMDEGTSQEAHMSLVETREGLVQGLADARIDSLDLLGFDMCLMGQLEVAVELQDTADVLVFSEEIEPGNGWPYDVILPKFTAGTMGARRLGQEIVLAYDQFYRNERRQGVTQSAVDLTMADEVSRALDALVIKLGPTMESHWPDVARTIYWARSYGTNMSLQPGATCSYDLMNVLQRLKFAMGDSFPAEAEYQSLVEAMDRFVIASSVSSEDSGTHGVAIYAPIRSNLVDDSYASTRMGQSDWMQHLQRLHQAQESGEIAPVISNVRLEDLNGNPLSAVERSRGHGIHFDVQGTNILYGQVWDLFPLDNGKHAIVSKNMFNPIAYAHERDRYAQLDSDALELLTVEFSNGSSEVRIPYDGLMFQVNVAGQAMMATMDQFDTLVPNTICVPITLKHPDIGEYGGTVAFSSVTWAPELVVLELDQPDGGVVLTSIDPPADAEINWLVRAIDLQTGEAEWLSGGRSRWGDGHHDSAL